MIKVLHVIASLDKGGGVQELLYNYYTHMNSKQVQFDFIVHGDRIGEFEPLFQTFGSKIYHITPMKKSFSKNMQQLKKIVKHGGYEIIHSHQGQKGLFSLYYAKKYGVKVRISHSHQAMANESILQKLMNWFLKSLLKRFANHWFACSRLAGQWLYGKKAVLEGQVKVINNAIDIEKYRFSEELRVQGRESLGLKKDAFVIGNVARFTYQKNHIFLIDIFLEIRKRNEKAILLLVGTGEREAMIREKVKEYNLESCVFFLGRRSDVPFLLNAMDAFLLPSHFEGLPISLVEAQCNGLYCVASDNITNEIKITDNIDFISLRSSAEFWADKIIEKKRTFSPSVIDQIVKAGYNIEVEATILHKLYTEITHLE